MSENRIIPSMDEILDAVNGELDETFSVHSQQPAQSETISESNTIDEGVDLFNASKWYLQRYPVTEKKNIPPVVKEPKKTVVPPPPKSEPVLQQPKKSRKGLVITLVVIALIVIMGIIFADNTGYSYPSDEVYSYDDYSSYSLYLHQNEPMDIHINTNEIVDIYFIPETSGYYHIYSSGDTDTLVTVYNGNGDYVGDFDDSNDFNFDFTLYLNGGEQYYLAVAAYEPGGNTVIHTSRN